MPIVDDDELDVFFDSDEFAETGTFTPSGGAAVAVTAIVTRADEVQALGGFGVNAAQHTALLRASEVDGLTLRDGALVIGAETWRVRSPRLDDTGLVWRDSLEPAS